MGLDQGLAELGATGIELPLAAGEMLARYLVLLAKWNRIYNLTAIREPERMVTHHVLDSLAVLPHLARRDELRLIDIGSGGGVPGIPLAIARPSWRVTLNDSNAKKGAFLRQAVSELGLDNAEVAITRIEDYAPEAKFDVVISRAFSDLGTFAACGRRLLAPDGRLMAMKGVYPEEELRELPPDVRLAGASALRVPGLDAQRHLIALEAA